MRALTSFYLWAVLCLWAVGCSPGIPQQTGMQNTGSGGGATNATGFPTQWESWPRTNVGTIFRTEPEEARDLHFNKAANGVRQGPFPDGTVFVKAHYRSNGTSKGRLTRLSVMSKGGGTDNGGWVFKVFDPVTKQDMNADTDTCVICHSQRLDFDYIFSDRSRL